MNKFSVFTVLDIPIAATTLEKTAQTLVDWSKDDIGRYVGVREVASVVAMGRDPELIAVAKSAAMNVPDGMPLVLIGKALGFPVSRTCGPDLMEKMMLEGPKNRLKHFFYGGKEGVADALARIYREKAPGVEIVGTYCPPFRSLTSMESAEIVEIIKKSGADIVWVGMSSPKQDVWIVEHKDHLTATLIGVGAAFDFHSGAVKRAPTWMQHYGLEWLHRLAQEPRRLWRRYLVLAPTFVFYLIYYSVVRRRDSV